MAFDVPHLCLYHLSFIFTRNELTAKQYKKLQKSIPSTVFFYLFIYLFFIPPSCLSLTSIYSKSFVDFVAILLFSEECLSFSITSLFWNAIVFKEFYMLEFLYLKKSLNSVIWQLPQRDLWGDWYSSDYFFHMTHQRTFLSYIIGNSPLFPMILG